MTLRFLRCCTRFIERCQVYETSFSPALRLFMTCFQKLVCYKLRGLMYRVNHNIAPSQSCLSYVFPALIIVFD